MSRWLHASWLTPILAAVVSLWCGAAQAQQTVFRDCPDCPIMINIPPGRFNMGSPPGEEAAEDVPQQYRGFSTPQVQIIFERGFALGRYPITRYEYLLFERATGRPRASSCWHLTEQGAGEPWKFVERQGLNWWQPSFAQTGTDPVVCVSWDDAQAYVAWLSQHTGKRYRLPTEAEWEFAVRAGTTGPRWWPGGRESACAYANVRDYALAGSNNNFVRNDTYFPCSDGYVYTSPVTAFPANPFGIFDALGNVENWMQDCWNPTLVGILRSGAARLTGDCSLRVVRGGSWDYYPRDVRAGYRYWGTAEDRNSVLGFRVARTQ